LRANEIGAEVILKATKVDGVLMIPTRRKNPEGETFLANHVSRRVATAAQGDGFDGVLALHGQQNAHHRFLIFQAAQFTPRGHGRKCGHAGDGVKMAIGDGSWALGNASPPLLNVFTQLPTPTPDTISQR